MKKLFLIFGLSLFLTSVGYCQGQPLQRFDKGSPLTLTIKADKKVYKLGEQITVEMRLTNVGRKAFYLNRWIFYHPHLLEAIVQGPKGIVKKTFNIEYDMKMQEKDDFVLLAPGKSYVTKIYTDKPDGRPYNLLGHVLEKLGSYTVSILYENNVNGYWSQDEQKNIIIPNVWLGKINSNTITIEFEEKEPAR